MSPVIAKTTCSFCGKHKNTVDKLIVSTDVSICNECVDLCQSLLERPASKETTKKNLDPMSIKAHLDQFVIGQDEAKIIMSVAIVNHYKRIKSTGHAVEKSNILMLGPTGSGKTLLAKTMADYLDIPFVIGDATSLTEAGYVGDDVDSLIHRLLIAADYDLEKCRYGMIYIDEIDKIARRHESSTMSRDVSGEGVQQALLKLLEGTRCRISSNGNAKTMLGDSVEVDTTHILFLTGGAFVGLPEIINRRIRGNSIGFGAAISNSQSFTSAAVTPDDLVEFGMIPEFVGRLPITVTLQALTKSDLLSILKNPQHGYISQYQWLFQQDGVKLEFTNSALDQIVDNTLKHHTGARGLKTELERVLMPHMYQLTKYQRQGLESLTIDQHNVVNPKNLKKANE